MLTLDLYTPEEVSTQIANSAKQLRLSANMSRKSLAQHSGVSLGSIQRFEQTGKISLEHLLKIAQVLSALKEFQQLFPLPDPKTIQQLLEREKLPKRGRL
ncbi:MAG: helix-turn-helix transcriptional regulator [Gammaproteobacteria bacterium]|jgi:transcriptional regulator with XRE-family HTH domain|nr:helix-turn-helix transcriptional regulator [Gammaproteobacteria bacterium]MBT4132595.1 helix-turn-helix transcriptional regulator [Candidatus Neomarinimicrobiota bacterium]MBT4607996.1 helix-turn-helix transcriptional regulator [Thiotrichales bacterium]MBT4330455.1 helix-turn-helix transcriptional regulator [Gammaproteobacteria bacterium]MBT5744908.1 helix-turn-helix transcriptional regulator [Gammaproteobacteria bacterium]